MRFRRPIGWVLCGGVFLATAGAPLFADDKEHYKSGVAAKNLKKWREAIGHFEKAVAERPRAGGRISMGGMFSEQYIPYYHLSVAHQKVGNDWKSKQAVEKSRKEGVIGSTERKKLVDVWALVENAKNPNKKEPQPDQQLAARAADEVGKLAALESQLQRKMKNPEFSQLVP